MKKIFQLVILLSISFALHSQVSYTGFIGQYPIELVTNIHSDGDARAIYAYSNYDEPIVINGKLNNGKLTLFEKDKAGKNRATLSFEKFEAAGVAMEGTWKDLVSGKQLPIKLTKTFDVDAGNNAAGNMEMIQPVALKNRYFKLVVSKADGNAGARVIGVKIFEKKTDKILQQIDVDCQLLGVDNISIDDYNFDGIMDFSVFESSYAGPNTSSLYFLYDAKTDKYVESGFTGTSLEFDSKTKTILERNQCCGGETVTNAEYKVVNNKMVLIKERCFKWDEKKQELVERPLKDCQ